MTTTEDRRVAPSAGSYPAHQHRLLAEMLDPLAIEQLLRTGVTDGWRCLDVGTGGGSMARWLASRVAPTGHVLATDLEVGHLPTGPRLDVVRHDVTRDPLPDDEFDLIHTRLVLRDLPERDAVLRRLVRALRPGGWLQVVEFDEGCGPALLMPDERARALYGTFLAARDRVLGEAGTDRGYGARAAEGMREAGLVDVDAVPHVQVWDRESPGTRLLAEQLRYLRERLLSAGLSESQLSRMRALLRDPSFRATSGLIYTIRGRRPAEGA